jgi:hypothetical protein
LIIDLAALHTDNMAKNQIYLHFSYEFRCM